jgi:glycosyltransferase involved in cell wall biosynthesis
MESSKGWGGQEKRTVRLVNALDKTRFKVFYAVQPDSKLLSKADEIDATMLPVAMRQSYDLKALRKLVGHIRREKIDLISTHSGKDAWLGALAGRLTGTPVVRVRHLSTPVKSVLSYNLSDRVVTVSQQVYDYLLHRGVAREKLRLIYTGIDTERFRPGHGLDLHRTFGIPEGKLVVGIVAVLRGAKRHLDLLEAIRPLPEIAVLIVGNGPQESKIRRAIEEMGLEDRVVMAGHREDIHRILPALDLFVLPSRMEALGTAILEASACAVPVLGSNVGGIPECVLDGKTGYLFEKENPEELRHKLKLLIDHPKRRREMGEAGRKMVEERFSTERMVRETETLYRELTDD